MSELLFKQYALTRNNFIKRIQNINPEIVDIQPKGFNNNIHWMTGHVLTAAEKFMFGFTNQSVLPANYGELFGNGTKPGDWSGDVPPFNQLIEQLQEQLQRIAAIPEEHLHERLENPFRDFNTYGELANLAIFHEANHLGQIQAMAQFIEAQK